MLIPAPLAVQLTNGGSPSAVRRAFAHSRTRTTSFASQASSSATISAPESPIREPISQGSIVESGNERARRLYERWGAWSLLLAWVPVLGDALAIAAGAMKLRLAIFLPLVAVGKASRYAVLAYAVLQA